MGAFKRERERLIAGTLTGGVFMSFNLTGTLSVATIAAASLGLAGSADPTVVTALGASNCTAEFADSLLPYVTLTYVDLVNGGTVLHTHKSAQSTEPQSPDGSFNTIPVVFRQIGESNV